MARESIWLEATTGQGNLLEAKPKWQITGRRIAATQRQAFAASMFFFSDLVMSHIGLQLIGVGQFNGWLVRTRTETGTSVPSGW